MFRLCFDLGPPYHVPHDSGMNKAINSVSASLSQSVKTSAEFNMIKCIVIVGNHSFLQ